MTTTPTAESGTQDQATKATATKSVKQCGCLTGTGSICDRTTQKAFAQGHDARMASRLAQDVAEGKLEIAKAQELIRQAGGSDLLVSKMTHSAELRKDKGSKPRQSKPKKENKDATPEAGDTPEAKAVASAGNGLMGSKVKVKHGEKEYDAVVVKDASARTVARHRLIGANCDHEVDEQGVTGDKIKK